MDNNTALANKKNRVGKSKLKSELQRLDREQKTELRMLNNAKQRFKSRYPNFVSDRRATEPSNVVMYETHNPGFCYRRNGECRTTQNPITNTSLCLEDIHALIFTRDEVDIEKVLCLHLLSAHRSESLTPPPRSQRNVNYLSREQSPLERLVERSKKRRPEDKLMKLLPVYVLDVTRNRSEKNETLIRDGRLAHRLIINEKVVQLVRSVMHALSNSNQDKLTDMVQKSKDVEYLKFLLCTHNMQKFITSLNGLNIISCCESYHLTSPFRIIPIELHIETPNGSIESLIKQIRKNIFKLAITSSWRESSFLTQDSLAGSLMHVASSNWNKEKELFSQSLENTEFSGKQGGRTTAVWSTSMASSKSSLETPRFPNEQASSYNKNVFQIERKIRSVPPKRLSNERPVSIVDNFDQIPEKIESNNNNVNIMDFERIAIFLTKKANNANRKDLANLQQVREDAERAADCCSRQVKFQKYSLKQTTCPACLQKWRQPLPSPKTSKIKKPISSHLLSADNVVSNSVHMISKMIDEQLKNWISYTATKSVQSSSPNSPRFSPRSSSAKSNVIEIIDLDDLDLAKIRQEIRENETRKKMNKFLGERNI